MMSSRGRSSSPAPSHVRSKSTGAPLLRLSTLSMDGLGKENEPGASGSRTTRASAATNGRFGFKPAATTATLALNTQSVKRTPTRPSATSAFVSEKKATTTTTVATARAPLEGSRNGVPDNKSARTGTTEGETGEGEALLPEAPPTDQVRVAEQHSFDDQWRADHAAAKAATIKAARFDFKKQIEEYKALVKQNKTLVTDAIRRKDAFAQACIEIESKLHAHIGAMRASTGDAVTTAERLKTAMAQIAHLQTTVTQATQAKERMIQDGAKLEGDYKKLAARAATTETKLNGMEEQMRAADRELAAKASMLATTKDALDTIKASQAEVQSRFDGDMQRLRDTNKQEIADLHAWYTKRMETTRNRNSDELAETKEALQSLMAQLEAINRTKGQAELAVQAANTEKATLRGERERLQDKLRLAEAEQKKLQVDLSALQTRLEEKGNEARDMLAALNRQMTLNEGASQKATNERTALEAKLGDLRITNAKLEMQVQEMKNAQHLVSSEATMLRERIADIESQLKEAKAEAARSRAEITTLRSEARAASQQYEAALDRAKAETMAVRTQYSGTDAEIAVLKARLSQTSEELATKTEQWSIKAEGWAIERGEMMADSKVRTRAMIEEREQKAKEEAVVRGEFERLNKAYNEQLDRAKSLATELQAFKKNLGTARETQLADVVKVSVEADQLKRQLADKQVLEKKLRDAELKIEELTKKLHEGEALRRKLHNTVQDLRGAVRVVSRVRPFLPHDGDHNGVSTITCGMDGMLTVKSPAGLSVDGTAVRDQSHNFQFDHVFPQSADQAMVFEEVSQLVQSALDGYDVCLFSYGQTGSGKSHTMTGETTGAQRGIIPRSVTKVMEQAELLNEQGGWEYTMEASFLEIYNEQLRDLLTNEAPSKVKLDKDSLIIKRDPVTGRTYVPDLTRIPVEGPHQIDAIMAHAAKHRAVASTKMNERSSRSHSVFTLYLRGINREMKTEINGTLNLCDLAGSERLSRSEATGARLKETQHINKSLSALSDVYSALATKSSHVPYRNSKLTYLLQNCFCGDGKTLMFVNLSPTGESFNESLCSLRFAARVKTCELGRAQKHVKALGATTPRISTASASSRGSNGDDEYVDDLESTHGDDTTSNYGDSKDLSSPPPPALAYQLPSPVPPSSAASTPRGTGPSLTRPNARMTTSSSTSSIPASRRTASGVPSGRAR